MEISTTIHSLLQIHEMGGKINRKTRRPEKIAGSLFCVPYASDKLSHKPCKPDTCPLSSVTSQHQLCTSLLQTQTLHVSSKCGLGLCQCNSHLCCLELLVLCCKILLDVGEAVVGLLFWSAPFSLVEDRRSFQT